MTQMHDTEGSSIPKNETGRMYFDAVLCDWNDGKGPDLAINIPTHFLGGDDEEYSGEGVMTVPLQAVLEDYLVGFIDIDGGKCVPAFTKWLRDYADRLDSEHRKWE